MNTNHAITVKGVGKKYRLRSTGVRTVKSAALDIMTFRRAARRDFWALKDVSFDVARGETLGIIGVNGAGKSTLLALLAGTRNPTCGSIAMQGTVSSLLELGAGFHPDLTGRENVYLCGAVMGLTRRQMNERFDAIVDFAGLQDFIDEPVKHYSSGMYVRLGFAVAVEVDPDVLLIDEVLAVGDSDFQRKCLAKMEEFRGLGKTLLIISHDLHTIQTVSDRILLLDQGNVLGIGSPESVVDRYESLSTQRAAQGLTREWGTGTARITGVEVLDETGTKTDKFQWGAPLAACISYDALEKIEDPVFGFAIADRQGRIVHGSNTQIEDFHIPAISGAGSVTLHIDHLPLAQGTYLLSFSLHSADHGTNYHRLDNCVPIAVESTRAFEGCVFLPSHWSTE